LPSIISWLTSALQYFLEAINANPEFGIPDTYSQAFHNVDRTLSKISEDSEGKIHSGCTAVTAFLRIEDPYGKQSFITTRGGPSDSFAAPESNADVESDDSVSANGESTASQAGGSSKSPQSRLKKALKRLSRSSGGRSSSSTPRSQSPLTTRTDPSGTNGLSLNPQLPPPVQALRRVLYVANAGDARGVLCRGGKALRLTYDHKGTDKQEAKRIMDSGGFVMSGRVNGVLAVTRSLGDSSMKEFVVGAPYTTETELTDDDELLILACDGVRDIS
jgi:protein phosphatase PTC1